MSYISLSSQDTRKTPLFTLFILSRTSDNTTSQNIGETNAWAVPLPKTLRKPSLQSPLGFRPSLRGRSRYLRYISSSSLNTFAMFNSHSYFQTPIRWEGCIRRSNFVVVVVVVGVVVVVVVGVVIVVVVYSFHWNKWLQTFVGLCGTLVESIN